MAKKKVTRKRAGEKKDAPAKRSPAKKAATKKKAARPRKKTTTRSTPHEFDRSIGIARDAIGNAIISGDGNVVVIQTSTPEIPEQPPPSETGVGPNPYKGLLAFHEEDADRFYGREELVKLLWIRLRDLMDGRNSSKGSPRLLPILGPSGSGKSSVARAGLIPELARRPLPGRDKSRVAVLTPGTNPLEALATVLARVATNDAVPVKKAREFYVEMHEANKAGDYDGLRRIADTLPDIQSRSLIILVDQFEEVFSLCESKEEQTAFIENLLHASAARSGNVSTILTLRTDFLDETQQNSNFSS